MTTEKTPVPSVQFCISRGSKATGYILDMQSIHGAPYATSKPVISQLVLRTHNAKHALDISRRVISALGFVPEFGWDFEFRGTGTEVCRMTLPVPAE